MTEIQTIYRRFLDILPEDAAGRLSAAMLHGELDMSNIETEFAGINLDIHRDTIEEIIRELIPVEQLVPAIYEKWRPVFRDGFSFIAARLSPDRLFPKLVEQLSFPDATPVEDRVLSFIRRVPILQKIGQTLARNNNLDADLRARLIILEDGIHEIDEAEIRDEVEKQLGDLLIEHQVKLEQGIYGEGSVSAVLRFTYKTDAGAVPAVFKVLKPFIPGYFNEDLTLLGELADYFDANLTKYNLGNLNLRAILDDVRDLYEREIDFVNERENLIAAGSRYAEVPGIRVPRPIAVLSTETITAMTEEAGGKITDAFPGNLQRRRVLARRLIECMVARPLFSKEEISLFHADPHVGNLRVDDATGDIVLLDWALTGGLTAADRRALMLLFLMLPLRDEGQMVAALAELSLSKDEATRDFLKKRTEIHMDTLPKGVFLPSGGFNDFLDDLLAAGARFSGSFLIFRKMLLTLEDVVEKISPGETVQRVVLEYTISNGLLSAFFPDGKNIAFNLPLKVSDVLQLGLSVQSFFPRLWIQGVRRASRTGEVSSNGTMAQIEKH